MMSNPILFLDDSGNRTKTFTSLIPSAICAATVPELWNLIEYKLIEVPDARIKYIFLDHDLGQEEGVDSSRPDCGMEIVRRLVERQAWIPYIMQIIIHSHNEPAALEMQAKLRDAGYNAIRLPFIHFRKLMEEGNITL